MRNYERFAAQHFTGMDDLGFEPGTYSALKFGCDAAAKKFGYELASKFFEAHSGILLSNQVVVMPSPYNFVPNAASVMTKHFVDKLNVLIISANGQHVETSLINRKVSYTSDYGFMTKEARAELISNDTFNVNKGYVEGKIVICIDDVRITGVHEDKLREIFERQAMQNEHIFFLYYASYDGVQADIEAQLNFSAVKTPMEYVDRIIKEDYHLIVRPIKYLLGQQPVVFAQAVMAMPVPLIEKFFFACLGEGYYKIPGYQENFRLVQKIVEAQ